MSQEKVDAYKKAKANRKKEMEIKKRQDLMYKILGFAIGFVALVWVVFSIGWTYGGWYNPFAAKETTRTLTAEELSSIRDKLGLDADGNPITTTPGQTTTAGETTTADGETSASDSETTTANGESDAGEDSTTAATE